MRKLLLSLFLIVTTITQAQKQYAAGLIDLEPEGIVSVITDIVISPDNKSLYLAGAYGRGYLLDISTKGKTKTIWQTNSISGLKNGSIATFSEDGKYILLRGIRTTNAKRRAVSFSNNPKSWQDKDDVCVLDATNGKVLFASENAYSISISANTVFISDVDGFKFISMPDGKLLKSIPFTDNEYAAISPSGKYIIESWDADKQDFKNIPSIKNRRAELKNAYKAKKLLVVYDASNLEKAIAFSDDEIDVVTNMQFSPDEKYVYLQMQLAGQENSTTPNPYVYQRVEIATGIIDNSFGIKGNFCKTNFVNNKTSYLVAGGNIGFLKQARIQDNNNTEDFASFETRYKLFKNATLFSPVALSNNSTIAYIYYEKQLFEWDYSILKKFFKKGAAATDEELAEKAVNMLDDALNDANSKLSKSIQKANINGDYIMDITISGPKGSVTTVFCESDDKTNIPMQNSLKDIIKKQEFDLGLPKEKRIKFRYTFQL